MKTNSSFAVNGIEHMAICVLLVSLGLGSGCTQESTPEQAVAPFDDTQMIAESTPKTEHEELASHSKTAHWIDDRKILACGSTKNTSLPKRLYTPEFLQKIKDGEISGDFACLKRPEIGETWLQAGISESLWREMLAPHAPVTIGAVIDVQRGLCPFCGKSFEGCEMTLAELREHPFQARTRCCNAIVYEKEADMPQHYKARPNHTENIPHLDGTVYPYRFYCPPGTENAPVFISPGMSNNAPFTEAASKRRLWFCSAGEVWLARMRLMFGSRDNVLEGLAALAYRKNNEEAIHTLAVIYDRLSEIYPGLPLYSNRPPHGFALGKDGKSYLTREAYLSETPEQHGQGSRAFWYREQYNMDKLNWGLSAWHDGVTGQAGLFADVFDLIRDSSAVKTYSQDRYGNPDKWEERVMDNVLLEAARIVKSGGTGIGGNTVDASIYGGLKLGLVIQDRQIVDDRIHIIRSFWDNWVAEDGLCEEGSYVYGGMVGNFVTFLSLVEKMGMGDLIGEKPLVNLTVKLGNPPKPLLTLHGMEDTHGDEYLYGFRSTYPWAYGPPATPDYERQSVCFPHSGILCLRAGAPGSRMEAFMDFQNQVAHTHQARLNLQIFHEGVNFLPDLGYANVSADPAMLPWRDLKYNYELVPLPTDKDGNRVLDSWRAWYGYGAATVNHCVAQIDGRSHNPGPCTFQTFHGGALDQPESWASFADVDAIGMFSFQKPLASGSATVFRRQVAAITLPNGRSALLDFHHLRGGSRHDILWHAPADEIVFSNASPEAMNTSIGDSLGDAHHPYEIFQHSQASKPFRWKSTTPGMWSAEWLITPEKVAPATTETREGVHAPWEKIFKPARLGIWGGATGSEAQEEIMSEQRPWPTHMREGGNWETVVFRDAMNHLVFSRQGKDSLSTSFFHVLEPRMPEQEPSIRQVQLLKASGGSGCGAVLACGSMENPQQIWVATTLDSGSFQADDFALKGRFGMISPEENRMLLFDGESLSLKTWSLRSSPSWSMPLESVIGDLTGSPRESALIVKSERPIPTDTTLVGRMLTVKHQTDPLHASGYAIAKISALPAPGHYRIDLADTPPFIRQRTRVKNYDPARPRTVHIEYYLRHAPTGSNNNRRIRFLESGFDTTFSEHWVGEYPSGWHCKTVELGTSPPLNSMQAGDTLITYTIQPGDTVLIPSVAAIKGRTGENGSLVLESFATGDFSIEMPGGFKTAGIKREDGTVSSINGETLDNGVLKFSVDHGYLTNGRGSLVLSKTE